MMVGMGRWTWLRPSASVALTCALVLPVDLHSSRDPDQSLRDIFAAYSHGQFDDVQISLRAWLNDPVRVRTLKRDVDDQLKRSLPVPGAAFALEAAAVVIIDGAQNPDPFDQLAILDLLETGCKKLRSSRDGPNAFEREWHLAAMALLSGPGSSLLGGVERPTWFWRGAVWLHEHFLDSHARKRFPADPKIALAWGISRELEVHSFLHSAGVSLVKPGTTIPAREKQQRQFLREAAIGFDEARQDMALKAEATLRLGRIRALQGQTEEALQLWSEVADSTGDTASRYLAFLFRGRTLLELKRSSEATLEFQRASRVRPEAQSARLALATLDYLANRPDDVRREITALLSPASTTEDPWSSYLAPGYREWPARLQSIRATVRSLGEY
jgi:tetratricopeptide (TPR) repeat protein